MCVKQFYGYTCGHCSIPTLVPCPLAASNQFFPTCGFPAERPIFTGEYCHACFRVLWNANVLKEEEEHRIRHLRGQCACEVRFEEDKETITREHAPTAQLAAHSQALSTNDDHAQENGAAGLAPQQWPPHITLPRNAHVGFLQPQEGIQMTSLNQAYTIAVGAQDVQSQLMVGEAGSGMRWYPNPPPMLPQFTRARHKAQRGQKLTSATAAKDYTLELPDHPAQCAMAERISVPRDEDQMESQQPMVVSSDIAELESP